MNREQIIAGSRALALVWTERERQYRLLEHGKFKHGPESSALSPSEILAVLTEELGEAAHHVGDNLAGKPLDRAALRDELTQVAAVAMGWIERLTRELEETPPAAAAVEPPTQPKPAVLMYHDVYDADERADWQRDPEVGC